MTKQKQTEYKLLKDLPDLPAGTVFVFMDSDDYYQGGEWYVPQGHKYLSSVVDHQKYDPDVVKTTPQWFAPIIHADAQ